MSSNCFSYLLQTYPTTHLTRSSRSKYLSYLLMEMLMNWEELYPILKIQAEFAVMRYEEKERRKDKIQELLCQSYEMYQRHITKDKPIDKNQFKQFITKRSREVDKRSICKAKYGGTSTIDILCYMRRRSDSPTPVICFDEWMTCTPKSKELVDDNLAFSVDFNDWLMKLNASQKRLLDLLIQGYKTSRIAEKLRTSAKVVKDKIIELRNSFVSFFSIKHKSLQLT